MPPDAVTSGCSKPVDARLESEQGAYQNLSGVPPALRRTAGKNCSFSAGSPKARFDALAARLRKHPLTLPDGEVVTYADMIGMTLGALYSAGSFPDLADYLQGLDTAAAGQVRAAKARLARPAPSSEGQGASYSQGAEGFYGVWCTDSLNPRYPAAWALSAHAADAKWPYFGRAWVLGIQHLRAVAGPRRRPLPRPLHQEVGQPGAG